ncbi:flagellar biosynthesis protein FlhF [Ornithinibacillus halotolerans]|uniref:Flagellar biosynthesis protein FlhF n=1 Tax=Ornithinibacillus halotolerans TaxID=1274357 RepID=A0A916W3E4_9BACI|nr:flagellar biosynthesis protein FlhF [Ornithinibacillus halotolerans]GGA62921.1 flagellar biosynthesis regulator FlhF [Ornithinibacillus halotolerans]
MKIKRYIAPTMPEAMNKIRKELGPDAVILSTKEVHEGGLFGLFKKRMIEVIVALDQNIPPVKQEKPLPKFEKFERREPARNSMVNERSTSLREKPLTETPSSDVTKTKNDPNSIMETEIISEMKNMRRILEQQLYQNYQQKFELDYQVIYQYLIDQEVNEELATKLVENIIHKHRLIKVKPTASKIAVDLKLEIEEQLSKLSFEGITNSAKVVHFVGPTGVGKTTTLAKVAARSMINEQKKVAFITMDTYRIAAIEQLKTYAKILDIPVEVVYSFEDYQIALEKLKSYDLILVDTAGRNYREEKYVEELKRSIRSKETIENYLVLSLTSKPKDILDIYHSFRHLDIKSLIFTKIDETRQYGSLLNIPLTFQAGIAYITDGQEVPDNLVKPTKEVISNYIVGDLIDP